MFTDWLKSVYDFSYEKTLLYLFPIFILLGLDSGNRYYILLPLSLYILFVIYLYRGQRIIEIILGLSSRMRILKALKWGCIGSVAFLFLTYVTARAVLEWGPEREFFKNQKQTYARFIIDYGGGYDYVLSGQFYWVFRYGNSNLGSYTKRIYVPIPSFEYFTYVNGILDPLPVCGNLIAPGLFEK